MSELQPKKVLVIGGLGGLGQSLVPVLRRCGYEVVVTAFRSTLKDGASLLPLDITDGEQVLKILEQVQPQAVMHLAAETDVDRCEKEPEHAFRVNVLGTENVAIACKKIGAVLVYISTGGIFDGAKIEPYTEFDRPNPITVYGRSKYEGEKIIQALLSRYFIFRAGWLVGEDKNNKKFVAQVVNWLNTQKELKIVGDKFGSLTFASDMSEHMVKIFQTHRYGLYHLVSGGGMVSRYEIALKIVEILGRKDVKVHSVSSSFFPLPAARPRSEAMLNYRLNLLGWNTMPRWQDSLERYLLGKKNPQVDKISGAV